jgi:ParB family chromosome partitioning protein
MTGTGRGLGKGLDALFNPSQPQKQEASEKGILDLPLDRIEPNPDQPRQSINEEGIRELAQSITEQGLLQPLLVRPHPTTKNQYQIIAGERRWRASKLAGLHAVPALIRQLSDSEALIIGLVENLQRHDLNPVEEAQALGRLLQELHISQDELARRIGRSRSGVANSLRLLQLESEILSALADSKISAGQARTLLAIPESQARMILFQAALDRGLTVRQMEKAASHWKNNGYFPPPVEQKTQQTKDKSEFESAQKTIQQALTQVLETRVKVSGRKDKGRITLAYTSEEELCRIIQRLGLDPEKCFT